MLPTWPRPSNSFCWPMLRPSRASIQLLRPLHCGTGGRRIAKELTKSNSSIADLNRDQKQSDLHKEDPAIGMTFGDDGLLRQTVRIG